MLTTGNEQTGRQSRLSLSGRCALAVLTGLFAMTAYGQAPETWAFPQPRPLRVRFLRGLWHAPYRIEEAIAARGGGIVADSWDAGGGAGSGWLGPGNQGGGWVWYFPGDRMGLMQSHVIVVCNINAKSFHAAAPVLAEYVQQGGSVLFLGGRWAFGKAYRESPLAAICPVTFPGEGRWEGSDLEFRPHGVEVTPGPDTIGEGFDALPWAEKPLAFWYHNVIPKQNATVILTVEDRPLLVTGRSGKGRVAVFAGSVMGEPGDNQLPFWEWDGWPQIMAATIDWLAGAPAEAAHGINEATRAAVEKLAVPDDLANLMGEEEPDSQQGDALNHAAAACHDADSTRFLLSRITEMNGDIPARIVNQLGLAVARFADASLRPVGQELVESGLPYKTALGLRVTGASRAEGAVEVLSAFHKRGRVKKKKAEQAVDFGEATAMETQAVLPREADNRRFAIRLNALAGLGDLGSEDALKILQTALEEHASGKIEPRDFADILTGDHKLYQAALMSMLRCGDSTAAEPLVTMLMENIYLVARARTEANKPKDALERIHQAIPDALRWQQRLYTEFAMVPDSVLPEVAHRIAAEGDQRIAVVALAAFADRTLPEEVKEILRKSSHASVQALGKPSLR